MRTPTTVKTPATAPLRLKKPLSLLRLDPVLVTVGNGVLELLKASIVPGEGTDLALVAENVVAGLVIALLAPEGEEATGTEEVWENFEVATAVLPEGET